jgi:hypothetical protein
MNSGWLNPAQLDLGGEMVWASRAEYANRGFTDGPLSKVKRQFAGERLEGCDIPLRARGKLRVESCSKPSTLLTTPVGSADVSRSAGKATSLGFPQAAVFPSEVTRGTEPSQRLILDNLAVQGEGA